MEDIYLSDSVVGPADVIEKNRDHIQLILDGHFKEVDLKKMRGVSVKGFPVYRTRINEADRLVFTTIIINGKKRLFVIEEIINHDYKGSRTNKKSKLNAFFKKYIPAIEEAVFEATDDKPSFDSSTTKAPMPVKLLNNQLILLNTMQHEALKAPLPLLVSGTAGSGKSCVAILLLEQLINKRPEDILYVSSSPELVKNMQRIWLSQPDATLDGIQFKTYEQLLKEIAPTECTDKEFVGKEQFIAWFKEYLATNKNKKSKLSFERAEETYQEFRIICACKEDEYLGLGSNQSLFIDKGVRAQLWRAYGIYQDVLKDKNQIDISFQKIEVTNKFAAIVVDEAQDFSNLQLDVISSLAINNQVCFCMDTNQRSEDILSTRSALLRKQNQTLTHVELPYTYRCAPKVATAASRVLAIKTYLTGGTADKFEGAAMQTDAELSSDYGIIEWINAEKGTVQQKEELKQLARSTQVAIVVPSLGAIEDTKKEFMTELVFTPETIKGLEYPTIILYGMFDDAIFKAASKVIGPNKIEANPNRVKVDENVVKYALPFNRVFTATTRAQQRLIIYQSETKIENLVRELTTVFTPNLDAAPAAPVPSSPEEWLAEADRLEAEGKIDIANDIRIRYTPKAEVVTPLLPPSKPAASAPMETSVKNKKKKKALAESAPKAKNIFFSLPLSDKDIGNLFLRADYMHQLFKVIYPNGKNLFENVLSGTNEAIELLNFLLTKPNLLKSLFNLQTLNHPITLENNTQWWLLGALVSSQKGMLFLKLLSRQKKFNLGKELIPESLSYCLNLKGHTNMSILFHLTGSETGIDIFETLIESNPSLIAKLPTATFFNIVPDPKGVLSPSSPLINLLEKKRLQTFASRLFELNPSLSVLPTSYHTEYLSRLILWSLLVDDTSFLILLMYLRDQDFAHAISEKILLEAIPGGEGSTFFAICTQFAEKVTDFISRFKLANHELCKKLALEAINIACTYRLSPLLHDVLKMNLDIDPNQLPNGVQPLVRAVMQGAENIVETLLLDPRINPDIYTPYSATPLYLAVSQGKENIIKHLIAAEANTNLPGPNNNTPLMVAAEKNLPNIFNRLLYCGAANPQLRNNKNEDVLMIAFRNANPEILLLILLSNKLDPAYTLTTTVSQCRKVASAAGQQDKVADIIKDKVSENNESITISLENIEVLLGRETILELSPAVPSIPKMISTEDAIRSRLTFMPPPTRKSPEPKNGDAPSPK